MKPEADQILNVSADQLLAAAMSGEGDAYGRGTSALHALLMKFVAREYERGAEIRAAENRDMRAAFAELAPSAHDLELRSSLEDAAKGNDQDLSISSLNASNAELRRLLIALHADLEDIGARGAEARIWLLLQALAARRALSLF
ncbi:MAG: hypothetical protein JO261_00290 [Alphaproteobacteria bacterium]|nr:hypothetical protein [Alphaproteobacteria bacterium]MBV9692112.1 hypothetical protein [Alphaproteobacteria bacterium]